MNGKTVNLFPQTDPYGKIAGVAARLGVRPAVPTDPGALYVQTLSGESYDLFAIIHALIDKMEQRP